MNYNEDVKISLPGDTTVADIRWFSVYDMDHQRDLGHVIVPEGINVPPSLSSVIEVGFTSGDILFYILNTYDTVTITVKGVFIIKFFSGGYRFAQLSNASF